VKVLVSLSDLSDRVPGLDGELTWSKSVALGAGVFLPAELEVSQKGNGLLKIANLSLHVMDSQNDGAMFDNQLLTIQLLDLNGDGFQDLRILGRARWYDEETEQSKRSEAVQFIYTYNPITKTFTKTSQQAYFNLEDGPPLL